MSGPRVGDLFERLHGGIKAREITRTIT